MYRIRSLTDDPKQKMTLILPDQSRLVLSLEFKPMQLGWFITDLIHGAFELQGIRIVNSPNMLHQFRNLIPFGLACLVDDGGEPMHQQDFSSDRVQLHLLDTFETQQFAEALSGKV